MAMEFESEVSIDVNFGTWDKKERAELIKAIVEGKSWTFEGVDTITVEPPEY